MKKKYQSNQSVNNETKKSEKKFCFIDEKKTSFYSYQVLSFVEENVRKWVHSERFIYLMFEWMGIEVKVKNRNTTFTHTQKHIVESMKIFFFFIYRILPS